MHLINKGLWAYIFYDCLMFYSHLTWLPCITMRVSSRVSRSTLPLNIMHSLEVIYHVVSHARCLSVQRTRVIVSLTPDVTLIRITDRRQRSHKNTFETIYTIILRLSVCRRSQTAGRNSRSIVSRNVSNCSYRLTVYPVTSSRLNSA